MGIFAGKLQAMTTKKVLNRFQSVHIVSSPTTNSSELVNVFVSMLEFDWGISTPTDGDPEDGGSFDPTDLGIPDHPWRAASRLDVCLVLRRCGFSFALGGINKGLIGNTTTCYGLE